MAVIVAFIILTIGLIILAGCVYCNNPDAPVIKVNTTMEQEWNSRTQQYDNRLKFK